MATEPQLRHVGVAGGDGLVGRFGDAVVLLTGLRSMAGPRCEDLLAVIAEEFTSGASTGSGLVRRLLGWLTGQEPMDGGGFGIAAPLDRGFVILLRGAVWCEISGTGDTRRLSGREALTWVDHLVAEPFDRLTLGASEDSDVRPYPGSDLRGGYVPGSGLVVTYAPSLTDGCRDSDIGRSVKSGTGGLVISEIGGSTKPNAGGSAPADNGEALGTSETVGPSAMITSVGAKPSPVPAEDVPPREATRVATLPIGMLTCADGPTIPLDRCYVLGRAPQSDPSVRDGDASPIQLQDPDARISRVHAVIGVDGRVVTVRDLGSTHGTYIAAPGAKEWTRVGPQPSLLHPGWSLRVDRKIFVFEPMGVS